MKIVVLIIVAICLSSCFRAKNPSTTQEFKKSADTIIVKQKNVLNRPFQIGFYSKSYSYYWVTGNDTLDFSIGVTEYKKDSTIHIGIYHKEPILFTTALKNTGECLRLMEEDFHVPNLKSINIMEPFFYSDIVQELSDNYEREFGRKNVSGEKINSFLLKSNLNSQLNDFFAPLNKEVKQYNLEKFHLVDKEDYSACFPNIDLTEYPDFTFNSHTGIHVELEDKY